MQHNSSFKERFSLLLDKSPISDSQIAEELNVPKQTLSSWRTGTRSPKSSMVIKIADYFGVDVVWLEGFDAEKDEASDSFRKNARVLFDGFDHDDIKEATENGCDIAFVKRVIDGEGSISLRAAKIVAEILGVGIDDLLKDKSQSDISNELAKEVVRLFADLNPDNQTASVAAMKAFLASQRNSSVVPD